MPTTKELLVARQGELERDIATLKAKAAPLREAREQVRTKMQPLEDEMRRLNGEIKNLEQPHLSELSNELAAIARALGSKSMKAAPVAAKVGE